ncbi:MAG TPA: beta-1,6-N-acetylglucosaminyltransferase [Caulobacteraceae bacterium]
MKRTAFLVVAHRQPEALGRLVARLAAPDAHTFIHLDARAPLQPFAAAVGQGAGHTFLEDDSRQAVHWCGFTMVEATHRLLTRAFDDPVGFERFFLLSGADYPIKPIEEIGRALEADRELIQIDRKLVEHGGGPFDRCANQLFWATAPASTRAPACRSFAWALACSSAPRDASGRRASASTRVRRGGA